MPNGDLQPCGLHQQFTPRFKQDFQGAGTQYVVNCQSSCHLQHNAGTIQLCCSLPGGFAVHGQSVKQTQGRTPASENGMRSRKLQHSASAQADSGDRYREALTAVARSNSMPRQHSIHDQQLLGNGLRAATRSASRGRSEIHVKFANCDSPLQARSSLVCLKPETSSCINRVLYILAAKKCCVFRILFSVEY